MPITRVIDKVMLPIGNRPTVDYVVEYCLAAGIRNIIFVVQRLHSQIEQYYGTKINIAETYPHLKTAGPAYVTYTVHDQNTLGYGTAPAVYCTQKLLQGVQRFVVIAGDAFIYNTSTNPIQALIRSNRDTNEVLLGIQIAPQDVTNFGILAVDDNQHLVNLVERPDSLPHGWKPLANISHYLFSQAIFPELEAVQPSPNGEYLITDAILALARRTGVTVVPTHGLYLDSGNLKAWVAANQFILENDKY